MPTPCIFLNDAGAKDETSRVVRKRKKVVRGCATSAENKTRLQSVLHQLSGSTIDGATYTVDNAGNRTAKTDQRAAVTSNYGYDAIYELTNVTQGTNTTESYTYDPVGNRLSSLGVSPYNINVSNELTSTPSTSYTYDNNGNTLTSVTGSNTTTYAWDFENRLSSVTLPGTGGTVSFAYDPFGRRIKKVTSTTTSVFAYDGDNLIEETNSSGAAVARYEPAQNIDEPLAMLRSGATSYFHADGLGSITSLSSAAGSIANTYTYDSFGKLTASTGSLVNPFQYTARESDTETGLYYYRARYYDQSIGRFISEDPARYDFTSFYSYVGGNPVLWQDPLGLWKCSSGTTCKDLDPRLKNALTCLENCSGLPPGQPLIVTCGTTGHPPRIDTNGRATGDPHFWGTAVDIGHNSNPGLSMPIFAKCFQACFPHKEPPTRTWGSYAQPEYNSNDPVDGWHYHIQYFGGAGGGAGFFPNPIHPHGH